MLSQRIFDKYGLRRSPLLRLPFLFENGAFTMCIGRLGDHAYYAPSPDCKPLECVLGNDGEAAQVQARITASIPA